LVLRADDREFYPSASRSGIYQPESDRS
jgi:hypothetical protein